MPRITSNKSNKRVQCKVCLKEYADATGLSRHSKVHRPDVENLMFKCSGPDCHYRTLHKARFEDHIRAKHTGEKPFTCPAPDCSYGSSSPGGLHRHRKQCEKLNGASPQSMQHPFPPKQLLPAVDAGMPLEEVITFMTSPQSNVESWFSEDLVSSSALLQSDLQDIPSSLTISLHANHSPSPEMVASTSATDDSLFMNTNAGGFTDPLSFFDSSFPVASPTWSDLSSSVSSISSSNDERLSPPLSFDFDQSSASSFSWDNSMSTSSNPLNFDVTETPSFPFSSTFPKNERLSPALSLDSSMEGFSLFPYEQLSTTPLFQAGQSPLPSPSAFDFIF